MVALALLQVGVTAVAARQIGLRLIGTRWRLARPGMQIAAETGVGLLLISYLIYGLAMIGYLMPVGGILSPTLMWVLLGALSLVALTGVAELVAAGRALPASLRGDRWLMLGACGALAYFSWMVMGAMLPPTSLDEMVYHLEVPAQVLRVGYLPVFTDNVLAYYPMGPQMLFAFGLGVAGDTASRMFHLLYLGLVMTALYSYARTFVPSRGAVLATALFMTVPTVMVIGHWAYIDMNFTLYALLALVGTIRYVKERQESEAAALRWAVFAGLMAGAAWTVKYTALQLVLLLVLVVLIEHLRTRPREIPYGTAVIGAIALLMFAPYLARTWSITGWPLFPFGLGPFELTGAVNWSAHQSELALAWQRQYGAGYDRALWERLMAMVWVFTSADANYTAYDGVIGSGFLLAPLAFAVRKRSRDIRMLGVFAAGFIFYWSLTTTQVRFLLPMLPMAAILVAVAAADRFKPIWTAAIAFLVAINVYVGLDTVLAGRPQLFWSGQETRDEFLARRLVPYQIYAEANRRLGPGDRLYLVNMRTWGYLLDLPGRGEMTPFPNGWRSDYTFEHYRLERALVDAASPDDVAVYFRDQGITHLMIDEELTLSPDALAPRQGRLLAEFMRRYGSLLYRNPRDAGQSLWRLNITGGARP